MLTVGEDVEELKFSSIAYRSANGSTHLGKQLVVSTQSPMGTNIPLKYIWRENECLGPQKICTKIFIVTLFIVALN